MEIETNYNVAQQNFPIGGKLDWGRSRHEKSLLKQKREREEDVVFNKLK